MAFVTLADVTEPAAFIPTLAEVLDVKEAEGRTLEEGVTTLIGSRRALLLLDNFEQIVAAAPEVARLIDPIASSALTSGTRKFAAAPSCGLRDSKGGTHTSDDRARSRLPP